MRSATGVLAASVLAGCASFSPDGGFTVVEKLARERIGQAPTFQRTAEEGASARSRVAELLKQPLSATSAVEIALLNNRDLQADLARLGIAEADLVQAGRLANPTLRFGRLSGAGGLEIDRALLFDVLGLIAMPAAIEAQRGTFEQAQLQAALEAVDVAGSARKAFIDAVATRQLLTYRGQVKEAADASSELARRMLAAGNFSKLAQLREQSFHADATLELARAQHRAVAARERLVRVLALDGDPPAFELPERLPDLPSAPLQPANAEQTAMDQRLDVLISRRQTEATAQALGLTRATRFINVLHAGYQNQSNTGAPRSNGFEVELALPLFDFGSARIARAEAVYLQAVNRTAQIAINARSEVREAYSAYRTAYDLARHHRDEIVPLRRRISEENLLRYNGMLASVFDLLADAREQIASVGAAVESLRDFWAADTDLQAALSARSPASTPDPGTGKSASGAPALH